MEASQALAVIWIRHLASRSRNAPRAPTISDPPTLCPFLCRATRASSVSGILSRASRSRSGRCGSRTATRRSRKNREVAVVGSLAARLGNDLSRALDLLEGEGRVVGVLEPVEPPLTSWLEGRREGIALTNGRDTAVLCPGEPSKLSGAPVKQTDTSAGHGYVEVIGAKVSTGAGALDNHGLAGYGAGGECEAWVTVSLWRIRVLRRSEHSRVAGTAPR